MIEYIHIMKYYNKDYPEAEEIVFVAITDFSSERGTYCELIEYNNIEGFILNTELDKRVSDPKKQFKFGKIYPMMVLAVSPRAIDLSYKKVRLEERESLLEKFNGIQKIKTLCSEFIFSYDIPENEVCNLTMWKFFETDHLSNPNQMYNDFLKRPELFIEHLKDIYPVESSEFIKSVKSRLSYTEMYVTQNFKLTIYEDDAITKLRDILNYVDGKTEISYVASPTYLISTSGENEEECDKNIKKCIDQITSKIGSYKSSFNILDKHILKSQDITIKPLNMGF